ncbi:MAG TPA: ectonucleotide pyrophosphatase/phosphodiesterase [Vicinamibacterales bacterium]|nr:ectonucleotide pyrophosphatase/phosphodiesterase [Vicinamibacterales bacterium]
MKTFCGPAAGLAALAAIAASSGAAPRAGQTAPARHVILVSIDGVAAFHLDNAAIELPNLRALAAAGAAAESSETVFPSMTHPSHTTLITGVTPRRHGVVDNTVEDRRTGRRFHMTNLPRRESIRVPTIFDVVHVSGRRTAAFFWPETRDDPAIDDNVAEVFRPDGRPDPSAVTPGLLEELRAAGVPIDGYYAFYDDPHAHGAADVALTKAAAHVFSRRRPALTAIHLLVTDKVQHDFGPAHYLSAAALTTADYCVGLLRQAVADAGLAADTAFIIAADHGFVTVRDEMNLRPALADPALDGHVEWRADKWFVFARLLQSFDPARHGAALDRVLARVAAVPGVARVIRPDDFAALGYPDDADNPYAPGQYIIVADIGLHLVVDPDDSALARRPKARPYHGHGYLPDHPTMYPLLILSGAGIAPGRRLGHVRNIDVAPTIAALLGLEFSGADGGVLTEALVNRSSLSR